MKGLSWHPLLYKLLHHRYSIRQWCEQVDDLIVRDDANLPLPALETTALSNWLQTSLSDDRSAPQVRECLSLLDRLVAQARGFDTAKGKPERRSRMLHDMSGTTAALLCVLDDIAAMLGSEAAR